MPSHRIVPQTARLVLATASAFLLAACATRQLRMDFATFSDAYATNMNWQMLLNLARLDQGHPAYFMAIGEIRLARTQSGTVQATGTSSDTDQTSDTLNASTLARTVATTATNLLSGNLVTTASTNASPTFVFIPINSEEAARQLLSPIPVEVFNTLYQQGWPVDQLLRVLVERIEVEVIAGGARRRVVLTNSPTRASPDSFARFVRACEVVRELQKAGGLSLALDERFVPLAAGELANVTGKDLIDAAEKGRIWQKDSAAGWKLGAMRPAYHFRAKRDILDSVLASFSQDVRYTADNSLENLRAVFMANLTVGGGAGDRDADRDTTHSVLVLRSYRNVLEAVAQEQRAFDVLAQNPAFLEALPENQRRPVLRIDWSGEQSPLVHPVVALKFAGRDYGITDVAGNESSLGSRWNRDVFRLLVNLSSQVTVDITKFQRQVLELSP